MSRSRTLAALALLLLVPLALAPLAAAQADDGEGARAPGAAPPPAEASLHNGTLARLAHWAGPDAGTVDHDVSPGHNGTLWFAASVAENATLPEGNLTAFVNLTSDAFAFGNATLALPLAADWSVASTNFSLPAEAPATAQYSYLVEVRHENGTLVDSFGASGPLVVTVVEAPAPPGGIPMPYLVGGGAAVVVGAGAALYALKQRRERRLMNQAPRRSQVMRELELERELEKVEEKDPEQAQVIKQEIRAQEQVREKRRELQILEAKRADVLKTLDLLRKRHETGGLTKLQYDNMVKKKQADLERIEADIAQMEAEDAAGGAAA